VQAERAGDAHDLLDLRVRHLQRLQQLLKITEQEQILLTRLVRGRCYDHNFLRFSPIFGEKIGVFLKNQCYDQSFG
jgi:hypothetical protein